MTRIGAMIRLSCRVNNISERQLERELGMSNATVHRFLRGDELTFSNVMKILNWLFEEAPPGDVIYKKGLQ